MSHSKSSLHHFQSNFLGPSELEDYLAQLQEQPQLTPEEMMQCMVHVQRWVKLMHTREKLIQQLGHIPSEIIWAGAANLSQAQLLEYLLQGRQGKQALIESSIRWVLEAVQAAQAPSEQVRLLTRAGLQGLEQAIETYDPYQHFSFIQHAQWWIQLGIERASQNSRVKALKSVSQTNTTDSVASNKKVQNIQESAKIADYQHIDIPKNYHM